MQISIIFATYSNSTALACDVLAAELTAAGHTVQQETAAAATLESLQKPDLLILASPSWDYNGEQGMPHEDFTALRARLDAVSLANKPTAVMALGDSSFTYFCGAATHLRTWLEEKGGKTVIEPLKIDQYYANENLAQEQIKAWGKQLLSTFTA